MKSGNKADYYSNIYVAQLLGNNKESIMKTKIIGKTFTKKMSQSLNLERSIITKVLVHVK